MDERSQNASEADPDRDACVTSASSSAISLGVCLLVGAEELVLKIAIGVYLRAMVHHPMVLASRPPYLKALDETVLAARAHENQHVPLPESQKSGIPAFHISGGWSGTDTTATLWLSRNTLAVAS